MTGRPKPSAVVAVRGELAAVEWGEEEVVRDPDGEARIVPFHAWSSRGVESGGLCKWRAAEPAAPDRPAAVDHLFLMLAGQATGARAVRLLHIPPGHAVAALDYPYRGSRDLNRLDKALRNLPAMAAAARVTPASVSLAGLALRTHPALARADLTLVGASFGSPFTIQAAAAERERYRGLALLYAFARLDLVLALLLSRARWSAAPRAIAHRILARMVRPYEPTDHLPRLAGVPLLILNDMEDTVIPRASIDALLAAAPPGTRVEEVTGGHVHPDKNQLIAELVARVISWSGTL
jgi:pimeloyl-ACP methyl ester carboxylesterase